MSGRDRGSRGRGDRGGYMGRGRGGGEGRGDGRGRGRGDGPGFRGGRGGGRGAPAAAVEVYSAPDRSIPNPNAQVTEVEDLFQKSLSARGDLGIGDLQLGARFPGRPGYGTRGQKVILWTNYFEMIPNPDLLLYRYSVAVQPDATGKKLSQIIRLLLQLPEYADFEHDIVTDFKSNLVSCRRLSPDTVDSVVQYRAEGEDEPRANAQTYRLRVKETGILTVSELTDYLTSTNVNTTYADKLPVLQALNIFLAHYAKVSPTLATIGSSKSFDLNTPKWDLGAGVSALRGFFSSVRVATCRILVNVNVSHGTFYDPLPLDQLIQNYGSAHQYNLVKLQSFLKGLRVKVVHLKEKKNKAGESIPRVKTIFGLAAKGDGQRLPHPPQFVNLLFGAGPQDVAFFNDSTAAPSSASTGQAAATTGSKKKGKGARGGAASHGPGQDIAQAGRYISVYEFFKSVHGRSIKNPKMPVVNVGNKENPSYLPAEVCIVMPGQNSRSKLDPTQTQQMIRVAVRKPWENANSIAQEGLHTVGLLPRENSKMDHFGVSVITSLITVPGRVLTEPKVMYQQGKSPSVRGGSWNMQDIKFNAGGVLKNWTYLTISMGGRDASDQSNLQSTMAEFHRALQKVGISAAPPKPGSSIVVNLNGPEDMKIETALRDATGDPRQASLVLVILPIQHTLLYNRIKHIGDVKVGVHTICVVGSKFAKGQPQYFANVALKFNLKLGGINQLVDNTRLGIINEDKTMVVGVDVTHPSPGSAPNAPSVAGMVAGVDRWLGQWPADLRIQESRKEMVSELDSMLKSRLQLWKTQGKHAAFPENLLVFRDGVSEGDYEKVLNTELPLLRKACVDLYPAQDTKKGLPHITIIIVGKRHHTRFYPTNVSDADRSGNPKNGTIIDRGVTEVRYWDFFLQSHTALQGTARPAHYYIVLDEIFAKRKVPPPFQNVAEMLEDLIHNMCYLFGRATKAVSICPPAYYADIVCERARCYLSGLFDMSTPSATPSQSVAGEGGHPEARTEDVLIHPNLRNTMFYI
ncbi:hypothetical protein GJ744_000714 [Endocarpon pusillum]|uniref:Piwi domain-containing protein n=1 Tax=Endocarpon pusillum TaxID=364733 RepID=A0A8H7E120_9EURO|nr:hypothetical protein GJ744_000714 [Endocarpon pusillum]